MDYLINFYAFILPLFIFSFFSIVGLASLSVLRSQRHRLQNLLLAPAIGLCVTLLPIFWLNRLGLPISQFATPLTLVLLFCSLLILRKKQPPLPIKKYLPFAGIFILALILVGRPLLLYGFNWLSFGNDDMTNYALAAMRVLHHGFFAIPTVNELNDGKDYSLFTWAMHVPGRSRSGSEMLLAWISQVFHFSPTQLFMPLICSFHLVLISVASAMVLTSKRQYHAALIFALLLSFSALTILGTLYQLIAQVAGVSLLMASIVILFNYTSSKKYSPALQGVLLAICISSLSIIYPEIMPFLVITTLIYFLLHIHQSKHILNDLIKPLAISFLIVLILLNTQAIAVPEYIIKQLDSASHEGSISLFPYFLQPSGLAVLWGLQTLAIYPDEPMLSITILLGIVMCLFTFIAAVWLSLKKSTAPNIITLLFIGFWIVFLAKNSGFALFKLSMYMQPFILSVFVVMLFGLITNKKIRLLIIAIFILFNYSSLKMYNLRSKATSPGTLSEIAYGSNRKLNEEYLKLINSTPKNAVIFSDEFNISIIKLQAVASYSRKFIPLVFPVEFFSFFACFSINKLDRLYTNQFFDYAIAQKMLKDYASQVDGIKAFDLHDRDEKTTLTYAPVFKNCLSENNCDKNAYLIADTGLRSVINRRLSPTAINNFNLQKIADVQNHLVFTDTDLGGIYYFFLRVVDVRSAYAEFIKAKALETSFNNIEPDLAFPNTSFVSINRYLLFRIIHPSPSVRLSIAMTNSYEGNGINKLLAADAVGSKRVPIPVMGRGAARVFSNPVSPQYIDNIAYIALDMNADGRPSFFLKTGLLKLFNKEAPMHTGRKVTTIARDISLISEDDYQRLDAPTYINTFPQDLANVNLEFSGIYEDGWVSEDAYFYLKQPATFSNLVITGMLPGFDPKYTNSTLTVLLDGKKVLEQKLIAGDFDVKLPVSSLRAGRKKVELHFSNYLHLPKGDNRVASAKLQFIGFV